MADTVFRPYSDADFDSCLGIFDANCPEYFAPNERDEYSSFLNDVSKDYEVCEANAQVVGAFGLLDNGEGGKRLNWIMLDPNTQGMGIGAYQVREFVREIGGEVIVESRLNKGTLFRICLPVEEASRASDPNVAAAGS